jgi:hypothetical protein
MPCQVRLAFLLGRLPSDRVAVNRARISLIPRVAGVPAVGLPSGYPDGQSGLVGPICPKRESPRPPIGGSGSSQSTLGVGAPSTVAIPDVCRRRYQAPLRNHSILGDDSGQRELLQHSCGREIPRRPPPARAARSRRPTTPLTARSPGFSGGCHGHTCVCVASATVRPVDRVTIALRTRLLPAWPQVERASRTPLLLII